MKKILITGANSYIGESFAEYAKNNYAADIITDTLDMRNEGWREKSFTGYDAIFHVAGVAHADVNKVSKEVQDLYYYVNRDLALETAKKARAEGVRQFIFMSSMIIYGGAPYITKETKPHPNNFYGESKWQADESIRRLQNREFHVAVLRPPMIYGKGSKGNYPVLAQMAKKFLVFPGVNNRRSMLYIENLCEILCLLIINEEHGVFFPQNAEYVNTTELVKIIAAVKGHRIIIIPCMTFFVKMMMKIPGKVGYLALKAFGDSVYEMEMSDYSKGNYRIKSLTESVYLTEGDTL